MLVPRATLRVDVIDTYSEQILRSQLIFSGKRHSETAEFHKELSEVSYMYYAALRYSLRIMKVFFKILEILEN